MKLFKNKVGRPSNETLKKRKVFYLSVASSILLVIIIAIFALNHFNIINLKGSATNYILGDVNMDGTLSKEDSNLILEYVADKKVLTDEQLKIADINKDGKVSSSDSKIILQSISLKKKDAVRLYNTKIYSTSFSKKAKMTQTATYYIWNSSVRNGRIRVTTKKSYAGNIFRITGWVYVDQIEKISESVNSTITVGEPSVTTTTKRGDIKKELGSSWNITVSGAKRPDDFTVTASNEKVVYYSGSLSNNAHLSAVNPGRATVTIKVKSTGRTYTYNYVVAEYSPLDLQSEIGFSDEQIKNIGTINSISIYEAKACGQNTSYINNIEEYKKIISNLEKYQRSTIKRIYFLDDFAYNAVLAVYNSYHPGSVGVAAQNSGFAEIFMKCSYYEPEVLMHEVAHAIDYRYQTYKILAYLSDTDPMASLYNKYSPWNKGDPLSEYSYTDKKEFFAAAYASHFNLTDYYYPNEFKNAMKQAINNVKALNW